MNPSSTPTVSWRTHLSLVLLALVYIFSFIDRQVIAVLIEPIKRDFGASDTQMGLLSGLAFGLLYAAMGVPVGRLADRFNRRNIIAVCCGLWSLATLMCGMVGQFWQLVVARMSVAVGEAGGMAPSISVVSDLYPRQRRSLAISLFMMGPHFGVLIGLALGGWIAQVYGWRAAFIAFGAPGILLALCVRLWVQEPARGAFEAKTDAAAAPTAEPLRAQVVRLLQMPAFRRLAIACGLGGLAGYGYGVWIPSFLMRSHGLSMAQAGLMFGVASGGGAVLGALFCGWLGDRMAQRNAGWQLILPMIGMLTALPCAIAFILWPNGAWALGPLRVPHAMVFAVLFAFFASWWAPLSYSAVSQMVRADERSVAAALLNFFITLFGSGLGPFVTGLLSDQLMPRLGDDALRWALVVLMSIMLPAGLILGRAVGPYRQRVALLHANSTAS